MKKFIAIVVMLIVAQSAFAQVKEVGKDTLQVSLTDYQKAKLQSFRDNKTQLDLQYKNQSKYLDSLYRDNLTIIIDANIPLAEVETLLSVTDSTVLVKRKEKGVKKP